ncbi:MAG: prolipoprotein diacylglyceryl transferase [Magnetococcales bacterium]|nr:prolipoprotein diacylglyceryl transferase [Magnetococcales bacterium]MBF0148678.1 prolipoprotein diacylglyceryl transferase [Magnetococcales bacterium]MBF0173343.1 prolipoprotein diacylglyceryl transferase [Magnetococcales bacterium]MBF0347277.1 prolipoprotein diacylglyceryl transferase [Magnetococcales bacterium]MBF0631484.1 prolipoprotein diacylglyceryl transferase [Magnetococcales bacterium]
MIIYPEIDPVVFSIGPLVIRWYGVMYSLAFLLGWPLLQIQARRMSLTLSREELGDFMIWILAGVILGGRLGYIVFYQSSYYLTNPAAVFKIWEGGMSFHGGLLGVAVAICLFARKKKIHCLTLGDLVSPIVPVGLFLGRIGNFINGELWGRTSDLPWAMIFPHSGPLPRHPSQLYEAFLEGVVLFAILWWMGAMKTSRGALFGIFLLGYGAARFVIEFFREPDAHLGLLSMGLSMGQWLCVPMVLAGIILIHGAKRQV